jgi:hypothetical protein
MESVFIVKIISNPLKNDVILEIFREYFEGLND